MIRLNMKNYNMILIEKLQKTTAANNFTYSPLGKASGKQTKPIENQDKIKLV